MGRAVCKCCLGHRTDQGTYIDRRDIARGTERTDVNRYIALARRGNRGSHVDARLPLDKRLDRELDVYHAA